MINGKNILIYFTFIIFIFSSCDLLRFSRFEVVSWSPGNGFHALPEKISVSLLFSDNPDKDSVEKYFSLSSDNGRINGTFTWNGKKMIFNPLVPLEINMDYNISLSADARNTNGLSMDSAFEQHFTTRPSALRPAIISIQPGLYEEVDNLKTEIRLDFSAPVPILSLYSNISFNPSMTGFWVTENNGMTAVFTPSEQWTVNKRYEIKISSSLTGFNGLNTGKDFNSVFTTGIDHEIPVLIEARRISKDGTNAALIKDENGFLYISESFIENQNWEKDDRLQLLFSKPVDILSVKNSVIADNAPSLVMETPLSDSSSIYRNIFTFKFNGNPSYGTRLSITVKSGIKDASGNETEDEYVFRILANGKNSKPPSLAGIRIPMAPGSDFDKELVSFGADSVFSIIPINIGDEYYPPNIGVNTWIELYFEVAEGAAIDPFSIMENFVIDTGNNVLNFSPRKIKTDNFTVTESHDEWQQFYRLEIEGILTNSVNFGIVNIKILPGLRDSFGNRNENLQSIHLVK